MLASFSTLDFRLSQLVDMIDHGSVGLPEIQRPFVWKRTKVRDLFDSMYRGFPVGYFLFWRNDSPGAKRIGSGVHQVVPDRMIVDGQQRLTSLYSVLKRVPVIDEDYREARIEIGFNPLEEAFVVTSAAHRRNRQWIPDISVIWQPGTAVFRFVGEYIERLREDMDIDADTEGRINAALDRLLNLRNYPFTAIELSAETEAEAVADIFVRINSAGVELNQADFILTLMSVHQDDGRKALEAFCRAAKQPGGGQASPFNYFIDPSPDQLLRVAIGYGFRRGRLKAVYNLLRGRELDAEGQRAGDRSFARLAVAQEKVLDLSNWHQFLQCVMVAGFRSKKLITATNTLLYGYVLFLIGKLDYMVPLPTLRPLLARWIFMSALTSRYSGSYESTIEADLARIGTARDATEFADTLERIIAETLTDDYWSIRLPNDLETTAARSPTLYAYYAALNLLDARVLFSTLTVRELLDPAIRGDRLAIERHHLFPQAFLKSRGIDTTRDIDQIANFALLEWPDNARIGGADPAVYAPPLFAAMSTGDRERAMRWHALPTDWETMDYPQFLHERRMRIAAIVREGFQAIGRTAAREPATSTAEPLSTAALAAAGENAQVEFKATARWNVHADRADAAMEHAVAKTVAGFLNAGGGTLLVGVADDGSALGLDRDYATLQKKNADGLELWLSDFLQACLGKPALACLSVRFEGIDGREVLRIDVARSPRIVFLNPPKGPAVDDVFVRFGNSTRKLTPAELLDYSADWAARKPVPTVVPEGL